MSSFDPPREFELPRGAAERHLRQLRELDGFEQRSPRRPTGRVALVAAGLFAIIVAVATAAATGLFDRDVTRADLAARLTTTTRTVQDCTVPGDCGPRRTETVGLIEVLPSDGITFVDTEGKLINVVPATGVIAYDSASRHARELSRSRTEQNGSSRAAITLPDGGTRSFAWRAGEGSITVTDRRADGTSTQTVLRSGDVVPLLPGTLADQPLTPDKAVTFDLGDGDHPLWIYPLRNEVHLGGMPWRDMPASRAQVPPELARRYGVSPTGPPLPTNPAGGSWSYQLEGTTGRTVTWETGDTYVTVTDRDATGRLIGEETVTIGRRLTAD